MSTNAPSVPAAMAPPAQSVAPVTVPLHPVFVPGTGFKLGIQAGFTPDPADLRLYEFDTGGPGLWAAYSPSAEGGAQWWPASQPVPPGTPVSIAYASGNRYQAVPVTTSLYLAGAAPGEVAASLTATVAQIRSAGGSKLKSWQQELESGTAPLYGNFYGDFGADLDTHPMPGYAEGLRSVLLQMPDGRGNGFVVEVGAYPAQPGAPVAASLQVGLSAADLSGAVGVLPLAQGEKGLTAQGVLYLDGTPVNAPAPGAPAGSAAPQPTAVLFDTGAPSTHVWTGTVVSQETLLQVSGATADPHGKGTLPPGIALRLVYGDVTILDFTTGAETGKNLVTFSPAKSNPADPQPQGGGAEPQGYVNTGLNAFFGNRLLFYPGGGSGFISISPAAAGGGPSGTG